MLDVGAQREAERSGQKTFKDVRSEKLALWRRRAVAVTFIEVQGKGFILFLEMNEV